MNGEDVVDGGERDYNLRDGDYGLEVQYRRDYT